MSTSLTRRRLLGAAALAGGGVTLAAALQRRGDGGGLRLRGALPARFGFLAGAAAVGRECLRLSPDVFDERSVLAMGEEPADWDRLSRRISDDLDAGRTIAVRGWTLSLTEARLYALLSLLSAGR